MTEDRLAQIRPARERKGMTLGELSRATNIPMAHLRALEEGRLNALPSGPYVSGYLRIVAEALDMPAPDSRELTHPVRRAGMPLTVVRILAWGSVVSLLVAAWVKLSGGVVPPELAQALASRSDVHQRLEVMPRGPGTLTVYIQGGEAQRYEVEREQLKWYADNPIVVEGNSDIRVEADPVGSFEFRRDGQRIAIVDRETDMRQLVFLVEDHP